MSRTSITTEVNTEAHLFGEALANFVGTIDKALEDGWQPGEDLPQILSAALTELAPQVSKFEALKGEFKTDTLYAAKAVNLSAYRIAEALLTNQSATPVV